MNPINISRTVLSTLLFMWAGMYGSLSAADDPMAGYITLVKQIRAKDGFNANFSGVWQGNNAILFEKWVYVISCKPWRIQQINADPATAEISFNSDALVLPNVQPLALIHALSRKRADGNGMLYLFFSTHEKPSESSLYSFSLDAKTGAVALKGTTKLPADHVQWTMDPQNIRLYSLCEGKSIAAYRFADDGLPVEDGTYVSTGYGREKNGFFSNNGRHLYIVATANPANPNGRVDVFDCDVPSGKLTLASTLSLPDSSRKDKGGVIKFCGASPDGKYFYVLSADEKGEGAFFVLKPDAEKGTLTVASSEKPLPGMAYLNFNADGKAGFYCGNNRIHEFTCDPNTGALTWVATSGFSLGNLRSMVLDREHGNVFTVSGAGVDSFKLK